MDSFVVEEDAPRLDAWLAKVSGRARTDIQRMIERGLVSVDGLQARKSSAVKPGQTVTVASFVEDRPATEFFEIQIPYQDEHLAVVRKPAGVVVHPTPGDPRTTLVDVLATKMPLAAASGASRPGIVHRLDKDTSGLMVVAKNDEAYHLLVAMIKAREVERHYMALVMGTFTMPRGTIEAPVDRSPKDPTRMAVDPSGKPSATSFRVREAMSEVSLLEVTLQTGRMHQIRVHMDHIKHPVIGDSVYGKRAGRLANMIELSRPFLHAVRLKFTHPITGEAVDAADDLPDDLETALVRARSLWGDG